jgi:Holliday junction resolvasome RuvABC endonuclease subunit
MANVLALDLGTKTGFALRVNGKITGGTLKLRHDRAASGARFLDFRIWLTRIIKIQDIRGVFFERVYAHKGTEAAHVYGGFMYALAAVCEELRVKCRGFDVGSIKKHATGKGNATKAEVIAAMRDRGFDPGDDNEADALAILCLALETNDLPRISPGDGSFRPRAESGGESPGFSLASEIFR